MPKDFREKDKETVSPPSFLEKEAKERALEKEKALPKETVEKEDIGEALKYKAARQIQDDESEIEKAADKLREVKYEGRRLENLMLIAQDKGAGFAIKVAQKMNDACLLDLLHDKLVEKGITE